MSGREGTFPDGHDLFVAMDGVDMIDFDGKDEGATMDTEDKTNSAAFQKTVDLQEAQRDDDEPERQMSVGELDEAEDADDAKLQSPEMADRSSQQKSDAEEEDSKLLQLEDGLKLLAVSATETDKPSSKALAFELQADLLYDAGFVKEAIEKYHDSHRLIHNKKEIAADVTRSRVARVYRKLGDAYLARHDATKDNVSSFSNFP